MAEMVQARCPSCQNVLRIPAAWLGQSFRCAYCKMMFAGGAKAAPAANGAAANGATAVKPASVATSAVIAAPVQAAPPVAAAVMAGPPKAATPFSAAPAAAAPASFSFDAGPRAYTRRSQGRLTGFLLLGGVVVVAVAVGILAWPEISSLFQSADSQKETDPKKLAQGDGNKGKSQVPLPGPENTDITPKAKTDKPSSADPTTKTGEPKVDDTKKEVKVPDRDKKTEVKVDTPKKPDPVIITKPGSEFPRRALLISVSNYLLFNPLFYGEDADKKKPGGSTGALARRLSLPPMNFPASQIFELADGKKGGFSTTKGVIESAIADFAKTARAQDRVLVFFSGHAMEIEGEAYLVPVDANRKNPESLIKLTWVFDQLKECKARQRILMLDVFRYPVARGEEIEGTGAMTEGFVAKLNMGPPGVQVWASCSKEQQGLEFENGSLFVQAFNQASKDLRLGITNQNEAIPVVEMLPEVNKLMKSMLAGSKDMDQVSLMIGREPDSGTAYNKDEPLAAVVAFKEPGAAGGAAPRSLVDGILEEIGLLPPTRPGRLTLTSASMPGLPLAKLKGFEADYANLRELEKMVQGGPEKYPLRALVFEASEVLKDVAKASIKEYQPGPVNDALKKTVAGVQLGFGKLDFRLKGIKDKLDEVDDKIRAMEPSKRWLAHFDFAKVMINAKIIYFNEYNYLLAGIRADRMPELEGASGWRVATTKKLQTTEGPIKKMNRDLPKMWDRISKEYPDTPWAIIANRESMTAMGLEWRSAKE